MGWWREHIKRSSRTRVEGQLLEECQAFLDGTYALQAASNGSELSAWMLLNVVAHSDLDHLRVAASNNRLGVDGSLPMGWREAAALLAKEIMDLSAGDPTMLANIQWAVLVPLELRILKDHLYEDEPAMAVAWARAALRAAGG